MRQMAGISPQQPKIEEPQHIKSGLIGQFSKDVNTLLRLPLQNLFKLNNIVQPSLHLGLLKADTASAAVPAAVSVVQDNNNYVGISTVQLQRGSLTLGHVAVTTPVSAAATEPFYTVPANKEAYIVALDWSGGGTFTGGQINIEDPTATKAVQLKGGVVSSTDNLLLSTPITMTAGYSVNWLANVSVGGALSLNILYREYSI